MLLNEVLLREGNIEHIERGGRPPTFDDHEVIGRGSQAVVYRSTKSNRIIKVLHILDKNDAVYRYVDMVMDHQDNPYFPKIYFAATYDDKRYSSKNKGMTLVIEMEKLIPFQNAKTIHMLEPLLNQLGITIETAYDILGDYIEDMGMKTSSSSEEADMKYNNRLLSAELRKLFSTEEGRTKLVSKTNNSNLREALLLTGKLLDSNIHGKSRYYDQGDMHDENVMIRLTSNIPQLVIVDPVITLYFMN